MNSSNESVPLLSVSKALNMNADISSNLSAGSGLSSLYSRTNSCLSSLPSGLLALNLLNTSVIFSLEKPLKMKQ